MAKQIELKERNSNTKSLLGWIRQNGAWNATHTSYYCNNCGKSFLGSPSDKSKFCSKECYYADMRTRNGATTSHWKGGRSYNNKCIECGIKISFAADRCKKCAAKLMPHLHTKDKPWLRTKEAIRKALVRRPLSSLELKFQQIIEKNNLPYKFVGNGEFMIERKNPDFINVNGEKKAIEVYARIHKEKMRNMSIEDWKKQRQEVFAKYGWEVVFFDETEINEEYVLSSLKGGVPHS